MRGCARTRLTCTSEASRAGQAQLSQWLDAAGGTPSLLGAPCPLGFGSEEFCRAGSSVLASQPWAVGLESQYGLQGRRACWVPMDLPGDMNGQLLAGLPTDGPVNVPGTFPGSSGGPCCAETTRDFPCPQ